MKLLKRLFCKHDYNKAAWEECFDSLRDIRYSRRLYICSKCGKSYWIDGKFEKTLISSSSELYISSAYGNNQVGIRNCNIKYFAIVEHDQTSEEIIKTSQLLMDKFDIH